MKSSNNVWPARLIGNVQLPQRCMPGPVRVRLCVDSFYFALMRDCAISASATCSERSSVLACVPEVK